jgi:hypothetical protein
MKRIISILLCLGLAQCANAAILFYKQNLTVTVTGGGRSINRNYTGFILIDSTSGDVVFVPADVKSKTFKVDQPDHSIASIQSSPTATKTVLQIKSGSGEGLNAKGLNSWLADGLSQPMLAPNTFTVGGADAYVPAGLSSSYLFEYHGAFVFDKGDTATANQAGRSLSTCTDDVRAILANRGFTEN